jgi:hypothetical protein
MVPTTSRDDLDQTGQQLVERQDGQYREVTQRGPSGARRLPCRQNVTKVQLPTLYLRNLDKMQLCTIVEPGPAWRPAGDICPHPTGQGERFLTIRQHLFCGWSRGTYFDSWIRSGFLHRGGNSPVTIATIEVACNSLGLNNMLRNCL